MSTVVDKRARAPRVPAAAMRARILPAAGQVFCELGFDHAGVRDVAAVAGVDPASVIRLFGSKEALFAAVAGSAFSLDPPFDGPSKGLGLRIARHLLSGAKPQADENHFDEFRFLLRSAASPTAAPILSAALHADFIGPLGRHLGEKEADQRAVLATACVLGFTTLQIALGSPVLDGNPAGIAARLGAVLQACLDP